MKLVLAQVTESLVVRAGLGLARAAPAATATPIMCGAGLLAEPLTLTLVGRFVVSGSIIYRVHTAQIIY